MAKTSLATAVIRHLQISPENFLVSIIGQKLRQPSRNTSTL